MRMTQYGPLGGARGTRCVKDTHGIVEANIARRVLGGPAIQFCEVLYGKILRELFNPVRSFGDQDNVLDLFNLLLDENDAIQQIAVHDNNGCISVIYDVSEQISFQGHIDRNHDSTDFCQGKPHIVKLDRICHDHAYFVTLLYAKIEEGIGNPIRVLVHFLIGDLEIFMQ